mmetsp:Transcript_6192/g.10624  ORF Transcript_6192/g.10624 Transcript_6192/m.10624 type:complete len:219 (+) Transcript_6192:173-829(+)
MCLMAISKSDVHSRLPIFFTNSKRVMSHEVATSKASNIVGKVFKILHKWFVPNFANSPCLSALSSWRKCWSGRWWLCWNFTSWSKIPVQRKKIPNLQTKSLAIFEGRLCNIYLSLQNLLSQFVFPTVHSPNARKKHTYPVGHGGFPKLIEFTRRPSHFEAKPGDNFTDAKTHIWPKLVATASKLERTGFQFQAKLRLKRFFICCKACQVFLGRWKVGS